jgi:tRNA-2-methylthio-N6-dimethylallyladenosine synthase
MPSVFIKTYGCQMNERDSEAVSAQLLARGYSLAPSETEADVVLLNTCSVRDMAEQKALSKMQNVIGVDRKRGGRQILGFLGCMAQSRGGELIEQLPDVDLVPSTRGEERSRPMDDIVAECRELAARGVREITLLGQIVTSYGRRMYPVQDGRSAFVQLIEAVHAIDGIDRIRFTSPHPKGYGDDLVEAYGRLPKLVESAHLPVQSGSDRLLKLMHRGYTRQRFLEIIGKLRAVRPGIGLSTDIIVGFPGETEEDFQETVSLCREVQFDQAFLFKYSRRRDTPAAEMPGQLPEEVIEDRHQRLLAEINRMALAKFEAHVGGLVEVLVEGPSHRNPARFEGRTRTNKLAVFEGSPRHHGQILDLRIERVGSFTLYGNPAIVGLD